MTEEDLIHYNVFNVQAMAHIEPRRLTGRWRRLRCWLGLHIWGFSHCPACGTIDPLLAPSILIDIRALPKEQRDQLILDAWLEAKEVGLELDKPFHEQFHG